MEIMNIKSIVFSYHNTLSVASKKSLAIDIFKVLLLTFLLDLMRKRGVGRKRGSFSSLIDSAVFIADFEHISLLALVFLLFPLST